MTELAEELNAVLNNARFVMDEITQKVKDRQGFIGVENMETVRELVGTVVELARTLENVV